MPENIFRQAKRGVGVASLAVPNIAQGNNQITVLKDLSNFLRWNTSAKKKMHFRILPHTKGNT